MEYEALKKAIEDLIDKAGVEVTICLIQEICQDKAEHIRTNRQSDHLASLWDKQVEHLDALIIEKVLGGE